VQIGQSRRQAAVLVLAPNAGGARLGGVVGVEAVVTHRVGRGVKRASTRPLIRANTTAPAAPSSVNWFSTLTPMALVAHQLSAKSTGIAAAHATARRVSPCRASTTPCAAPSDVPLTRPISASAPRSVS